MHCSLADNPDEERTRLELDWFFRQFTGWNRSGYMRCGDATVYGEARTGEFWFDGVASEYSATAYRDNAVLVPVGARSFQVQSSRTVVLFPVAALGKNRRGMAAARSKPGLGLRQLVGQEFGAGHDRAEKTPAEEHRDAFSGRLPDRLWIKGAIVCACWARQWERMRGCALVDVLKPAAAFL